jgi:hypothetical protein
MSKRLQIIVPEGLDARVRKAARRRGIPVGQFVREAMERALSEPRGPVDPLDALAHLGAPTADLDQMLAEIEAGRG